MTVVASPRRLAAVVLLLLLDLARPAAAQDRIVVRPEPGTSVVAVELLLAVGAADEPPEQNGVAYVSARSTIAPARAALDSLGARLDLRAERDALAFTLIAAPDAWQEATRVLLTALFRDPLDGSAVARELAALRREREAAGVSPAEIATLTADSALFGAEHPWAQPREGSAVALAQLTAEDVDTFVRQKFTPDRATVAVAGPVVEADARAFLRARLDAAPLPLSPPPAPQPADTVPVQREFGTITAWVVVSYPFGARADVDALRLLASIVQDRFAFGPSRRAVYDVAGEVTRWAGGGEVRFTLVVPPGEAERWGAELRASVAALAASPLPGVVARDRIRRYRGERLYALSTPEARAAEMARTLLRTGARITTFEPGAGLNAQRLQAATAALAPPVTAYVAPNLEGTE